MIPRWRAERRAGRSGPAATAKRGPFVLLIIVLLLGALTALLALNTASAANELAEQQIVDHNSVVAAQVQALQVDLAGRRAPANLARAAGKLGMVPATNPAFLRIGSDGSVALLGVAAPVKAPAIPVTPPPAGSSALIPGTAGTTGTPTTGTPATGTPTTGTPTTVTLPGGAR